ncbi:hypothetical protein DOT_1269 [Desulfosporosinus sp. OT]|nr:hypothetical protein DOT_1269 [Desulfosporosinus sp. OT]
MNASPESVFLGKKKFLTIYVLFAKLRQARGSSFQNSVNTLAQSLALFRLKA